MGDALIFIPNHKSLILNVSLLGLSLVQLLAGALHAVVGKDGVHCGHEEQGEDG